MSHPHTSFWRFVVRLVGITLLASCAASVSALAQQADVSRQVLASQDGWAAAQGGTRGGADAAADQVYDVHNRTELVAALQRGGRLHNGRPVDVLAALRAANPTATVRADVGWQPTLHGPVDASADVAKMVRASAGAGRL